MIITNADQQNGHDAVRYMERKLYAQGIALFVALICIAMLIVVVFNQSARVESTLALRPEACPVVSNSAVVASPLRESVYEE